MNKKKSANISRNTIVPPMIINMDDLSYASDQDIDNRKSNLDTERMQAIHQGYDPYLWEVELAYVDRELTIRDTRRKAHEIYVKNNPDLVDSFNSDFADEVITDLN